MKNKETETEIQLKEELRIKDMLIDILKEALNDSRYCDDHIIFRKCNKKDIQCGDCLIKEFYHNLNR